MARKKRQFAPLSTREPLSIKDFREVQAGPFRLTAEGKLDNGIKTVQLTPLHTKIVAALMHNHPYVVEPEFILTQTYPPNLQKTRTVKQIEVALVRIRKVFRDAFDANPIVNIKNRGYKFE